MTTSDLPLLVVTDLDGTLLDHETYAYAAARDALWEVAELGGGVVLASSKTAAEIAALRAELGLAGWPAIVENGAGILPAGAVALAGADYADIRRRLESVPDALRALFRGFGDMDTDGVAHATGLTPEAAELARRRQFSEPGLWSGTDAQLEDFLQALAACGLTARRGGRFLTVSFGRTKAQAMARIVADLRPDKTVALGDAPNDVEMIAAADIGIIVANPHSLPLPRLEGEDTGRVRRTSAAGPEGWNIAVLEVIRELGPQKGHGADG